jgi:hypothetical protein
MNRVRIDSPEIAFDFDLAKRAGDRVAEALLGECVCMSWYDRAEDREAPAHVSECHDDSCDVPGYVDYARNRGASLMVEVGGGAFAFCYRPLGEFAGED